MRRYFEFPEACFESGVLKAVGTYFRYNCGPERFKPVKIALQLGEGACGMTNWEYHIINIRSENYPTGSECNSRAERSR